MHQGDYSSAPYYHYSHLQNLNPTTPPPADHPPPYASAPPFSASYSPSDYYSNNYPPYPVFSDPTAPSPSSYDAHGAYQHHPFDQHQTASNYSPPPPNPNAIPTSNFDPSMNSAAPHGGVGSTPSVYDLGGYYGGSPSDLGSDMYGKRSDSGGYGDGVYAYEGGKSEPYGSHGTAPNSSTWQMFDDYGRPISSPSRKNLSAATSPKVVRAVPKVETQEDVTSGVQKFRVKLLAESGGQSTMDVLCQVGLDGIRMLDPTTNRTLRIYPLETITRCDVTGSSTFAFWSKGSVDLEPKRIRLQSNSYTTNNILDTVTAATVQFKEMGGSSRLSESLKITEQPTERKKGLVDWVSIIKPANEEKDHWVPDEVVTKCSSCGTDFGAFVRKHHCRNCGEIFCDKCTHGRIALTADENAQPVRVCDQCMAEVTQRLSNAKEVASKPAGLQSHEDMARKLQEEMERNRKSSSGSKSDAAGRRMREVECPTCTVHLQVEVPSSGSETIECGVCQHPFLVSAH